MAHQTDEYCLVERIVQAKEFYRQIIADWIGGR
jgi:acetylornithine deacetylase/succinyl-diaminopimelate desuccinylase-like protein